MNCQLKRTFTREISSAGNSRKGKLVYLVSGGVPDGGDPGAAALEAVRQNAPEYLGNTPRANLTLTRCHGSGVYEVEVEYRHIASDSSGRKIGEMRWSFEACGSRERVLKGALLRSCSGNAGIPVPDPGERINWNGRSGDAEQVDGAVKLVPYLREKCVATFRESSITNTFKRTLYSLTGTVNSDPFHGWNSGEVLFCGVTSGLPFWNDSHIRLIDLTFSFAIRRNRTNFYFGGVNLGNVKGWEIPWSIDRAAPEGGLPRVLGVYLSRVYSSGDFSELKIH